MNQNVSCSDLTEQPETSAAIDAHNSVSSGGEPLAPDPGVTSQEHNRTPSIPVRVGVLLVHGIGEQRRFEHLEAQAKKIASALLKRQERTGQRTKVTFEVLPAPGGAPYQSEQDSWMGGRFPAVRAVVQHGNDLEQETHLYFHEVWWADAGERLTLAKQIRFWIWGLAMWSIPGKNNSDVAGFAGMEKPIFPDARSVRLLLFNRIQLFATAWIFLLSSFSITLAVFVLKRLNFGVWSPVNTFVNYVSGVKLYTQNRRSGGGPLEGIHEPPRFTIRRRMVRALVDVATADYDRWYVLAHSLGSVVAFNGLMTHAHSIPNYLDQRRWNRLLRRPALTGPPRGDNNETIEGDKPEIPPRPLWIADQQVVVYREKLYSNFCGFLTYGSPLDKFAGMWPAYVPINRAVEVFRADAKWVNIFDRTDPVAAALKAYRGSVGLSPLNYGYKASTWLLLGHLKYLDLHNDAKRMGKEPADCVAEWLLTNRFVPPVVTNVEPAKDAASLDESAGWYSADGQIAKRRVLAAYAQWIIIAAVLTLIGVWALRWIVHSLGISFEVVHWPLTWIIGFLDVRWLCGGQCTGVIDGLLAARPSFAHATGFAICGVVVTTTIGVLGRIFRNDNDDPQNW
jgi:hypothetical protein